MRGMLSTTCLMTRRSERELGRRRLPGILQFPLWRHISGRGRLCVPLFTFFAIQTDRFSSRAAFSQ